MPGVMVVRREDKVTQQEVRGSKEMEAREKQEFLSVGNYLFKLQDN